ncbi:MAG: CBS domain-containing protein [Armatimonadota bacterium]|nr:CBS domain-containing protein [Armatimonadota bacterium]MDW8155088.1 CBS domain-containing protein [Armatimonadota bacterium]
MRRLRARDVMTSPVVTVRPDTPVVEAARIMARRRISGLPVVDEEGRLVGIVTEADLLLKEAGPGGLPLLAVHTDNPPPEVQPLLRRYEGRVVADVMTREVVTAQEDTPLHQVAALMARKNVNRVPVVRGRQVVGIVSRNDVLKAFLVDDEELAGRVREALRELEVPEGAVQVEVRDGVVRLRGQLSSPAEARLVSLCVRGLDGVVGVDTTELAPQPEG